MPFEIRTFRNIDLDDPFFDDLKTSYAEFSDWFAKKADATAYVFYDEGGALQGFLYLKVEEDALTNIEPKLPAAGRLKVGTFKINAHGTKLGERFIKKIFDQAIDADVESAYVTVFPKHAKLIELLNRYGFDDIGTKDSANGQERVLMRLLPGPYRGIEKSYPLVDLADKSYYWLSIYPNFHTRLFPDSKLANESPDIVKDVSHANSIHKIYIASIKGLETLKPGDVVLIYRTSDDKSAAYYRSVITSLCVVEEYRDIHCFASEADFLSYCKPHSVFDTKELSSFWATKRYRHVLRFTYNFAFKKRVTRKELLEKFQVEHDYAGFVRLTRAQLLAICNEGGVNARFIVG